MGSIQGIDPVSFELRVIANALENQKVLGFDKTHPNYSIDHQYSFFHTFDKGETINEHYETGEPVYLRISQFVENNRDKLSIPQLVNFNRVLDNQIKVKSNADGLLGFIRHLFNLSLWRQTRKEKSCLEGLRNRIQVVINSKLGGHSFHPASTQPLPSVMTQTVPPSFFPSMTPLVPPSVIPVINPMPATPFNRVTPPPPSRLTPPPPSSVPTPPNFMSPPSFPVSGIPMPTPAVRATKFANEPTPPSFSTTHYKHLEKEGRKEELIQQINIIKTLLKDFDDAFTPVKDALNKVQELKEKIRIKTEEKEDHNKNWENADGSSRFLEASNPNEVAFLYRLKKKTNEITRIPYFPDALFEEVNKKRVASKKIGADKPLPEALRKSVAIRVLKDISQQTLEKKLKAEEEINKLKQELIKAQAVTNNGIPLSEFKALLERKENVYKMWQTALKNREDTLQEIENGKANSKAPNPSAPIPSSSSPISVDSNLLPGEEEINSFPQDMEVIVFGPGAKNPYVFYKDQVGN